MLWLKGENYRVRAVACVFPSAVYHCLLHACFHFFPSAKLPCQHLLWINHHLSGRRRSGFQSHIIFLSSKAIYKNLGLMESVPTLSLLSSFHKKIHLGFTDYLDFQLIFTELQLHFWCAQSWKFRTLFWNEWRIGVWKRVNARGSWW